MQRLLTVNCFYVVVGGCHSDPCMNGATCNPVQPDTYNCSCAEKLFGRNCNEAESGGFKYLIIDERLDWENARNSCLKKDYNLTSINSTEELDLLSTFVG